MLDETAEPHLQRKRIYYPQQVLSLGRESERLRSLMPINGFLALNKDITNDLLPLLNGYRRILLWGDMGVGKSILALQLLRDFSRTQSQCQILELDPGTPPFGIPGAISSGWWNKEYGLGWGNVHALCTLNAGRFRLPLCIEALRLLERVSKEVEGDTVIIDPPGVVRGVGGAELLLTLVEALKVDIVVVLYREGTSYALRQELASLSVQVLYIAASGKAKRPGKLERSKNRTKLWDSFLADAVETKLELDQLPILGTPPPLEIPGAWKGRQIALLDEKGETLSMGEVARIQGMVLHVRMGSVGKGRPTKILVRDGGRDLRGRLTTFATEEKRPKTIKVPGEMTPPVIAPHGGFLPVSTQLGPVWATLVGGVLGDPLLHVRLRDLKKSFLFDLGDPARLAAKVAHQVDAIFLSHAHLDHIMGFPWFLRSRIGILEPCKIFGPEGTIKRIESFIGGITWDRIGERGPRFEVVEILGSFLRRALLQPGKPRQELSLQPAQGGVLMKEERFDIKSIICDHKIPSIAYSLVFRREIQVRKERLVESGITLGSWLGRLKQCIAEERMSEKIKLPNGESRDVYDLAEEFTSSRSGKKLVYAADMADSIENRKKLIDFARSAHIFFCETAFSIKDKERAEANQHLTTLATMEIARGAKVERLIPFHFSRRYHRNYLQLYDEMLEVAGPVEVLGHFSG